MKFNIGILASGGGSNFEAIAKKIEEGYLQSKISVVIHNNKNAMVAQKAKKYNIETYHISTRTEGNPKKEMERIYNIFTKKNIDLIVLAGYMKKIDDILLLKYPGKIINIHPGPLPEFGGKGYYGLNVHKAIIDQKVKKSGPTVHIVDNQYDHGQILGHYSLDVYENETPEHLAQRVLELEHVLFPRILKDIEDEYINL